MVQRVLTNAQQIGINQHKPNQGLGEGLKPLLTEFRIIDWSVVEGKTHFPYWFVADVVTLIRRLICMRMWRTC